jgi:hypothetical protein
VIDFLRAEPETLQDPWLTLKLYSFHPHYDGRFASKTEGYEERNKDLHNLVQAYLSTMADLGAETWLMHGTLLGWWWNRKIMPWDSDIDVQMSLPSLNFLAEYYNMTVHRYRTPSIPDGRDYMLEINPNYVNPSRTDKLNVIDARWVDTTSGLFIDITAVRRNESNPVPGLLQCKDGHEYLVSLLSLSLYTCDVSFLRAEDVSKA